MHFALKCLSLLALICCSWPSRIGRQGRANPPQLVLDSAIGRCREPSGHDRFNRIGESRIPGVAMPDGRGRGPVRRRRPVVATPHGSRITPHKWGEISTSGGVCSGDMFPWEVDNWIALAPRADHFWRAMHNAIAQLINELPERA
jgi:hypothetical protein